MPRATNSSGKKGAVAPSQNKTVADKLGDFGEDEELHMSQQSSDEGCMMSKSSKKRQYEEEAGGHAGQGQDFSSEMNKMLECFGADITKTLVAKRKRLETYTQSSLRSSNKRVEDVWKTQHGDRQKLNDEFHRQVGNVFTQWETDLDKTKDQEEKLQNLFRQQQKLFQQTRVIQSQRLKTIRQLHDQYMKGMEELDKTHQEQQTSVHSELRKEMALLQKKILIDTQQQEMASVKKSLQTMLL